jgi:hypothetical protein
VARVDLLTVTVVIQSNDMVREFKEINARLIINHAERMCSYVGMVAVY